jgi:phage shock protein A
MTNEERQQCCTELRTADELAFYWRKLAADEIESLSETLNATQMYLTLAEEDTKALRSEVEKLKARLDDFQIGKARTPFHFGDYK